MNGGNEKDLDFEKKCSGFPMNTILCIYLCFKHKSNSCVHVHGANEKIWKCDWFDHFW